ncbi:UNVERIFIED_CONTAM: hypothetical protein Sradi_0158500 [Sesamum radiatum]|uniref:Uncharacterized protein n=1 Tax=Sesamum radiatum TaxID=300843 RepID=A0AAW2WQS4_SESRA
MNKELLAASIKSKAKIRPSHQSHLFLVVLGLVELGEAACPIRIQIVPPFLNVREVLTDLIRQCLDFLVMVFFHGTYLSLKFLNFLLYMLVRVTASFVDARRSVTSPCKRST